MLSAEKFDHTSVILYLEEANFSLSREDILQGLTKESAERLATIGDEGWELVSVVRYSSGLGATEALIAFFKRPK